MATIDELLNTIENFKKNENIGEEEINRFYEDKFLPFVKESKFYKNWEGVYNDLNSNREKENLFEIVKKKLPLIKKVKSEGGKSQIIYIFECFLKTYFLKKKNFFKKFLLGFVASIFILIPAKIDKGKNIDVPSISFNENEAFQEPSNKKNIIYNLNEENYFTSLKKYNDSNQKDFFMFYLEPLRFLESKAKEFEKISKNKRSQEQKDFLFYWNKNKYNLYYHHLKIKFYQIINENSNYKDESLKILKGRMGNKEYSFNEENLKFNPNLENGNLNTLILNFSKKLDYNQRTDFYKIAVFKLLIENNFGNNRTSSANALGPFQIKENQIRLVEAHFGLSFFDKNEIPYRNLKTKDDKAWRELQTGFFNISFIAEKYGIDLTKKLQDTDILLITYFYFQGLDSYNNILNLEKKYLDQLLNYSFPILYGVRNIEVINSD